MSVIDEMVKEGALTQEQADRAKASANELLKAAAVDRDAMNELFKIAGKTEAAAGLGKGILGNLKGNMKGALESTLPQVAVTALAMSGIGAATGAMRDAYGAIKSKITEHSNLQSMLEKNPSLANHPNQELVQDTFKTLHRFNPEYAKDPLVAGTFVQNAVDMERMDVSQVNALVSAAKQIQDIKPKGQDYAALVAKIHMSPEQRLAQMYQLQQGAWKEEDRPVAVQEMGWRAEDRPFQAQQLQDNAAAAAAKLEKIELDRAAAAEGYAANEAKRKAFEGVEDMVEEARTNYDFDRLMQAMRKPNP